MSRLAKGSTTLFSLITLVLAVIIVWRVLPRTSQNPQPPQVTIAAIDMQVGLIRSGLSAEALTAAGCSSQQAIAVVANARTEMQAHPTRISDADAAYASARANVDKLGRKVESGLASEQEVADGQAAASALETVQVTRQAALDAVFAAGTANLSQSQVALLQKLRANKSHKLPIEFLTVDRTDEEWLGLRNALSNEHVASKYGGEASSTCQSLLATLRANTTVATAKANAVANFATVSTSWNTATTGN